MAAGLAGGFRPILAGLDGFGGLGVVSARRNASTTSGGIAGGVTGFSGLRAMARSYPRLFPQQVLPAGGEPGAQAAPVLWYMRRL